jgi:hypothetical protein
VNGVERLLERADPRWVFPPTPPLEAAVLARVARRPRRRRLALAVAFAVLVLAGGAVAGTSVLDRLGIRGVELRWVDELPPTSARRQLDFGERVTLDEGRERVPFHLLVPRIDDLDRPTAVYHRRRAGMVTFVYEADGRPRLVLSQWRSRGWDFIKILPLSAPSAHVLVGDAHGYWIGGGGHAVWYRAVDGTFPREPLALAARTLVWQRGGITYRLEADVSRAEAIRIAESLR